MSFICSRALAEVFWRASCSDTGALEQSRTSPMPKPFSLPDKTTAPSRLSRFSVTCASLTGDHGAELLTWWLGDSHVKIFPRPELEQASTANVADSGQKWRASFAKYDPDTSSWKTAQCSLLGGSELFLETWPRWGSMRSGVCWEQTTWAPPIEESASGFWPSPTCKGLDGGSNSRAAARARGMWPTPLASDGAKGGPNQRGGKGDLRLPAAVIHWPTPTASTGGVEPEGKTGRKLETVVRTWPTPTASSRNGWSPNINRADSDDRLDYTVERGSYNHGQQTPPMRLNPQWVEWLQGWPIGHTALKPLAMARFQEWLQQHSFCWNRD